MKTISLKSNGTGRYDDVSPFIVADNKLEIKTELPNTNGEFFFISENNGTTIKKFINRDKSIMLDGLTAGELNAEIKHYLKGVLIKTYKVEPLIICEVDGTLTGTPEIEELRREIAAMREILATEQTKAEEREKELTAREENLNVNISAIIRFAFADYQNNVYLGGGTVDQFVKEYGFNLTTEEIKNISRSKEND